MAIIYWSNKYVLQEARRIVIAEIQHITYNEFLPIMLGKEVMEKFGLLLQKEVCKTLSCQFLDMVCGCYLVLEIKT